MATQSALPPRAVFGPFELDYMTGDLKKAGRPIRLRGQPMQVLMALLETPGELVGRAFLQERLWPGATFGDFDQGLNAAVNKLRQALADSAEHPRYIETIAGEGYRFLAPVHRRIATSVVEIPGPRAMATVEESSAGDAPIAYGRRRWIALAALIGAASIAYWMTRPVRLEPAVRTLVTPPEGFVLQPSATHQSFALSPDGTKVAYTAMDMSGAFHVFVRESDGSQRQLAGTAGAHTMIWPPDGKSLVVSAQGKLLRIPLAGDGQVALGNAPAYLNSGTYSAPGQLLLNTRVNSYTLSSSGGEIVPTSFFPWGQILPDGEHIIYTVRNLVGRTRHRARFAPFDRPEAGHDVADTDSRAQYTESLSHPGSGYLLYARAGNLIALPFDARSGTATGEAMPVASNVYTFGPSGSADFSVSAKGTLAYQNFTSRSQLAWVDRHGRVLETVGPADANVTSGRMSPDGKWIAAAYYDVANGAQDLWLFETKTGARRRLAPTPELRDAPYWSPDSKELMYVLGIAGTRVTFRGLSEGEPDRPVASPNSNSFPADWSRDGRYVLMTNTGIPRFSSEVQSDVWVLDLAHEQRKTALFNTPYHESNATFSPDGKWIAFTSNESGKPQIYLQAFRGGDTPSLTGPRFAVTQAGAQTISWRADVRELYYLGFDSAVYAVPVRAGANPEFGQAQKLFTVNPAASAAIHSMIGFDVSADGSRFLIPVLNPNRKEPSLTIVQNWESLLQQKQ